MEGGGGGVGRGRAMGGVGKGWEQLFLYVTHCINLIHIALSSFCFHEDIPKDYRVGLHKNSIRNS